MRGSSWVGQAMYRTTQVVSVESGGPMAWKPVTGHVVIARLDGQVREVLVTAWNSIGGAVRVAWPPTHPAVAPRHRFAMVRQTEIAAACYEPLDPVAFRADTTG